MCLFTDFVKCFGRRQDYAFAQWHTWTFARPLPLPMRHKREFTMWARLSIAAPAVAVLQMANAQCALAQTHPNVGGNVGINPAGPEPRFIIRVIEFFVADETGFDFWGSDDFFIVVDTQHYDLATRFRVDSGNWYSVPPAQQCIMPAIDPDDAPNDIWTCLPAGTAAPIVFNISGWDRGGPHWFANTLA